MEICKTLLSFIKRKISPYSPMDIISNGKYPLNTLSNFSRTSIQYDGVQINSIEGFLQSLKTADINEQRRICSLYWFPAKKAGYKFKKNFDGEHLHWQGRTILRNSEEYQKMLKEIYALKYKEDLKFRNALNKTGKHVLTHSIGKTDATKTILTTDEFTSILTSLRNTRKVSLKDKFLLFIERIHKRIKNFIKKCSKPKNR